MAEAFTNADLAACAKRELRLRMLPVVRLPTRFGRDLIVDGVDALLLEEHEWSIRQHHKNLYVYRKEGGRDIHLHREIIGAEPGELVDHRNGDGLDNRRHNLRVATSWQNSVNIARARDSRAGFIGIAFHRASGLWRARAKDRNGREVCTYHRTEIEAARARDELAMRLHGEFACLNFPTWNLEAEAEREIAICQAIAADYERLTEADRQATAPTLL